MEVGHGVAASKSNFSRRRYCFFRSCVWHAAAAAAVVWAGQLGVSECQQDYEANRQLDCYNNFTVTDGYRCGSAAPASCNAYLTFRSAPPSYDSAVTIGYLLGANASRISQLNNISDIQKIPKDKLVVVPVPCSCFRSPDNSSLYQHLTSYTLKSNAEVYLTVANDTYQGLATCQSLMAQNPSQESRNLSAGVGFKVPLRCACPSADQTAARIKYLLTYLVTWGDTVSKIAHAFGVDSQAVLDANKLSATGTIFPFTTILVPLNGTHPRYNPRGAAPPPAAPPQLPLNPATGGNSSNPTGSSSNKWVFVGVGIGAGLLVLFLLGFLIRFNAKRREADPSKELDSVPGDSGEAHALPVTSKSLSLSPVWVRRAIESLTLYKFEELEEATNFFSESNRIKAGSSVYRGRFKGDCAAVKTMRGNVSGEIDILKQINHNNVIRVSGFCMHEGNTYLVYEYAENGSLSDWLHRHRGPKSESQEALGWRQRVQIAYHVADALNYVHNCIDPPCIHKNLKSSNILVDGNWRAKVTNFGLARSLEEEGGLMRLTRHVVGSKGYMPPEYIQNGVVTPKLDVFAFGVVILELLSGRDAAPASGSAIANKGGEGEELLLSAAIHEVVGGDNAREKLRGFMDPSLEQDYPIELAFSVALLARDCVAADVNARPPIAAVLASLSTLLSSSLDWDPHDEFDRSSS